MTRKPGRTDAADAEAAQPGSVAAGSGQSDAWGSPATSKSDGEDPFSAAEAVRYERGLELGRGGMGRVVAARDRRLGRQVAIKEVRPGVNQRTAAAQLVAEAQLAAGLDHPSILAIHDAGRDARGQPFYAMRLVRGQTMSQAASALPTHAERLKLMRPLLAACHAVAHAHERKIIHRDLKPDNLLVGPHGETQVADWGLACTVAQAAAGGVVGTAGFMAPEVAAEQPASPRSDVYSLGATLVHVLHAAEVGADLRRLAATLPPELRAIAERCLDPDPLRRYPDAEALAEDLAAWLDGRRVAAHRYSTKQLLGRFWRAFRVSLIVGAIGLLVVSAVTWQGYRRTVDQRDRAIAAEKRALHAQSQSEKHLAAAYVQAAESAESSGAHAEAETLAAAAAALSASPAARGILARVKDGPEVALALDVALPVCRQLRLSPDGSWLLCIRDDEAQLLRGDSGKLHWRRRGEFFDGAISSHSSRVFLSNRQYEGLLLELKTGEPAASGITLSTLLNPIAQRDTAWVGLYANTQAELIDANSGMTHVFTGACTEIDKIAAIAFAPEPGALLVACDSGRLSRAAVGRGVEALGTPVSLSSPGGASAIAGVSDGTTLLGTLDGRLWAADRELPLWSGEAHRLHPSVQRLYSGPEEAVAAVVAGRGPIVWPQLAGEPVRLPVQDRRAVAFIDARTVAVAGERLRRYTLRPAAHPAHFAASAGISQAAVSPDGSLLAAAGGDGTITVWNSVSGEVALHRKVTSGVVTTTAFSPDGRRLAIGMSAAPGFMLLQVGSWESLPVANESRIKRLGYFASGLLWRSTYEQGFDLVDAQGVRRASANKLCITGSGTRAVASNDSRTALVFCNHYGDVVLIDQDDPQHGELLLRASWAAAVALSADRRTVAIAEATRVRLLDVASRQFVRDIVDPGQHIIRVAFSPDDRLLFAGELDGTVRVWRVADGVELALLRGHRQRVSDILFAPGRLGMLSVSWDSTIARWNQDLLTAPADTLPRFIAARWGMPLEEALLAPIR